MPVAVSIICMLSRNSLDNELLCMRLQLGFVCRLQLERSYMAADDMHRSLTLLFGGSHLLDARSRRGRDHAPPARE